MNETFNHGVSYLDIWKTCARLMLQSMSDTFEKYRHLEYPGHDHGEFGKRFTFLHQMIVQSQMFVLIQLTASLKNRAIKRIVRGFFAIVAFSSV